MSSSSAVCGSGRSLGILLVACTTTVVVNNLDIATTEEVQSGPVVLPQFCTPRFLPIAIFLAIGFSGAYQMNFAGKFT